MAHLDAERLLLLAFGEQQLSAPETEHLQHCEKCADDLAQTRSAIRVGRETQQARDLPAPPEGLWQRIADEAFDPHDAAGTSADAKPVRRRILGPRSQRRTRELRRSLLLAVSAAMVGVAATLGAQWLADEPGTVVAEVSLSSRNVAAQAARGTATIVETDDGLQMTVDVSGMPPTDGFYEVWLYDGSSTMIPVGTLGSAPLHLPASVRDVTSYPIIDISRQDLGQQAHGTTMLQGEIGE